MADWLPDKGCSFGEAAFGVNVDSDDRYQNPYVVAADAMATAVELAVHYAAGDAVNH